VDFYLVANYLAKSSLNEIDAIGLPVETLFI
jgi:hypothetical protein